MDKIVRNFEIEKDLDWTYGIEIKRLREELDRLEKKGATHIDIEPYSNYDSAFVDISAYANRIETDEEFKERIEKEQARQKAIEEREIEQLKKLQEKYQS